MRVCRNNVKNLCHLTHRTQLTGLSGRMGLFKQIHLFHSDRSIRVLNNNNAVSSLFPYHMAEDAADHMLHLLTTKEDCWIRLFLSSLHCLLTFFNFLSHPIFFFFIPKKRAEKCEGGVWRGGHVADGALATGASGQGVKQRRAGQGRWWWGDLG